MNADNNKGTQCTIVNSFDILNYKSPRKNVIGKNIKIISYEFVFKIFDNFLKL